jgi:hypothetical protein
MRSSSLDASLLDDELHSLLVSPLHSALKFFHVPSPPLECANVAGIDDKL